MERFWMDESSGFRWPATVGRPTRTMVDVAAGDPRGDTADMAAAAAEAQDVADAAVPEAGAVLVPAAAPVTADHGHAPIPAPDLIPSRTAPVRGSPSLPPSLGPVQDPNPGLVPEAAPLRRIESPSPGQDLKANQNLLARKRPHHPKCSQWSISSWDVSKYMTSVGA